MYNVYTSDQGFFFLEMQFGGGKLFLWGEKIGKTSKNKQNLVLFLNLGGFPPLRPWGGGGNKKKTMSDSSKFRVTMLNYYVGCKPQKATINTINTDSASLILDSV